MNYPLLRYLFGMILLIEAAFLALPRQKVKPTSHGPAIISVIQFIVCGMFVYDSKAKLRKNKFVTK